MASQILFLGSEVDKRRNDITADAAGILQIFFHPLLFSMVLALLEVEMHQLKAGLDVLWHHKFYLLSVKSTNNEMI